MTLINIDGRGGVEVTIVFIDIFGVAMKLSVLKGLILKALHTHKGRVADGTSEEHTWLI